MSDELPKNVKDSSSDPPSEENTFLWTLVGFLALLIAGVMMLRMPGAMRKGNELSFDRAVFHTVNAITLSGFPTATPLSDMQPFGQSTIFVLVLGGTILTLSSGALAVTRIARLRHSPNRILVGTIIAIVAAIVLGGGLLASPGNRLTPAAFAALAAIGNCGLLLAPAPGISDWQLHCLLLPLSLAGSLGVIFILELTDLVLLRGGLSKWTQHAMACSAVGFILSSIVLLVAFQSGETSNGFLTSATLATDARTFGLPVFAVNAFPRAVLWTLVFVMMTGGVSGGSTGGLKINTIWSVLTGVTDVLRGRQPGRAFAIACSWIGIYVFSFAAGTAVLLAVSPELAADRAPFLVVSALSCVGLSHDPIALSANGMFVLSAMMFLGRILPLGILWWQLSSGESEAIPVG